MDWGQTEGQQEDQGEDEEEQEDDGDGEAGHQAGVGLLQLLLLLRPPVLQERAQRTIALVKLCWGGGGLQ